jgi:putative membrane protein insertion efficiency factor
MITIRNYFKSIQMILIRSYQWGISPILPGTCRHLPTCSNFAVEAIEIHGPYSGLRMAVQRVLRCHPWGTSGYDPVPQIVTVKNDVKRRLQNNKSTDIPRAKS